MCVIKGISDDFLSVNWPSEFNNLNNEQGYNKFHEFYGSTCLKNTH